MRRTLAAHRPRRRSRRGPAARRGALGAVSAGPAGRGRRAAVDPAPRGVCVSPRAPGGAPGGGAGGAAAPAPKWIDTHCHLRLETCDAELAAARQAGVAAVIAIGIDVADSREAIAVASRHGDVRAAAGVHPHEAAGGIDGLAELLEREEVVAVGETGLDYHYNHSPHPEQRRAFAQQIALAHEAGLALVIHSRAAWDETFAVLAAEGVPERTVFHCFTGGPREAERALQIGAYLSFSGIVTFPKAPEVREAAVRCLPDRLLVETDAPLLAPVPLRGRPNSPANVAVVGAAVAQARRVAPAELAATTTVNACRAFGLEGLGVR
ncbi:MAG: TatD family deoxyribonuclease [Acidimicrobiia bacterium]|nr:TatD family deoxyribonuclease [Acidimicrobiia bacterium]